MRKTYILAILSLSSCYNASDSEQTVISRNSPIINGYHCEKNQFPASVEIRVDALVDMSPMGLRHVRGPICGGTLIGPRLILTAGHCLKESGITHGFGKVIKLRFWVGSIAASGWKIHPNFSDQPSETGGLSQKNDIGLLFLTQSLDIEPVRLILPEELANLSAKTQVDIVGWGQRNADSEQTNSKRTPKMCASSVINELGTFEMQIGSDSNSPRKCFGDSGGATYLTLPNGELRLVGITSRSYDSTGCEKGGIDTRVDPYLDWIAENSAVLE